jgi:uncharacterized membrane-anchored protein
LLLHNEIHARPTAAFRLPALVTYVAVLNAGVERAAELAHLQRLPGQAGLQLDDLQGNFLRLALEGGCTLKWERHSEFTRYSLVQPLPPAVDVAAFDPRPLPATVLPPQWLAQIPGRTLCAITLCLLAADVSEPARALEHGRRWFTGAPVVGAQIGRDAYAVVLTDFRVDESGFERILVLAPAHTSESRVGRVAARLVEFETYRMMAMLGFATARQLGGPLAEAEARLVQLTADMEGKATPDQALLDELVGLAAQVERAIAMHDFRFSATRAYERIMTQRLAELREKPIPGTQTIGEFMQRRLAPAMATVVSVEQRLHAISGRVTRTSALLRTRVDIAREEQNRQLLEKLTRGQALQLRLQSTVEGLSIAAISYYVISLVLYGAKALKSAGVPLQPELTAGALIPLVMWAVWRTTRRIHERLHKA